MIKYKEIPVEGGTLRIPIWKPYKGFFRFESDCRTIVSSNGKIRIRLSPWLASKFQKFSFWRAKRTGTVYTGYMLAPYRTEMNHPIVIDDVQISKARALKYANKSINPNFYSKLATSGSDAPIA